MRETQDQKDTFWWMEFSTGISLENAQQGSYYKDSHTFLFSSKQLFFFTRLTVMRNQPNHNIFNILPYHKDYKTPQLKYSVLHMFSPFLSFQATYF